MKAALRKRGSGSRSARATLGWNDGFYGVMARQIFSADSLFHSQNMKRDCGFSLPSIWQVKVVSCGDGIDIDGPHAAVAQCIIFMAGHQCHANAAGEFC
jgi:hypothetical protein